MTVAHAGQHTGLQIAFVTVGAFQENTYLVIDEATRQAVLVDPGADDPRVFSMIEQHEVTPSAIWLTHAHIDHIGGIAAVKRRFDVPIHLHPADQPVYDAQAFFADAYQMAFEPPPPPDKVLADGDVLEVGETRFTIRHTPGHAPGHVIFVGEEIILGGDLIFAGSIGRTDLPLGSPAQMDESLKKLRTLPPELTIYPGHGQATTIGQELRTNPFLNGSAYVKGYSA